jgi:hypothetical protein
VVRGFSLVDLWFWSMACWAVLETPGEKRGWITTPSLLLLATFTRKSDPNLE